MDNKIYETWKVLRNYIGKLDAKDALEVLRYYSLSNAKGINNPPPPPPDYIEVHPSIFQNNNGIYPWDIETLAREVILSSDDSPHGNKSLRDWSTFSKAMNMLKLVDSTISETRISQANIRKEIFRLQHRQFRHQTDRLDKSVIVRYYKLFSHEDVLPIYESKIGMIPSKILTLGITLWSTYMQNAGLTRPTEDLVLIGITLAEFDKFMENFSLPFRDIKSIITSNHLVDDTFFYQYNPLTAKPIVYFDRLGEQSFVCPSPNLLQLRMTRGLYYELFNEDHFDNAFGASFEQYVGEVANATLKGTNNLVYGEEGDPSENKKRCDWIIDQEDCFTIVECKTKRLAIDAYTLLDNTEKLTKQLDILADAVVQAYQSLKIYQSIGYTPPVYPYNDFKKKSVCVVTLEKWYINGDQLNELRGIVRSKLTNKGIDLEILDTVPYAVMGVDEFEKLIFLAKKYSIYDMIEPHNIANNETSSWEFSVHLNRQHNESLQEYSYVFGNEMDASFTIEARHAFDAAEDNSSQ